MTRTATEEQPSPQAPRNRRFMTRCPFALENQFVLLNHYTHTDGLSVAAARQPALL